MRHAKLWWMGLIICLFLVAACHQTPLATPVAQPTPTPRPSQTPLIPTKIPTTGPGATVAPSETLALPTPTPNGPVPAVLAEVSLGLPDGNAYAPAAVAVDARDIAYVVCQRCEGPNGGASCVTLVDLAAGEVLDMWPLPGTSTGPLTVGGGRLYVRYEDAERENRLMMLDSETGLVLADIAVPGMGQQDSLWVDAERGVLIVPMADGVQTRDAATLAVIAGARNPFQSVYRCLAYDPGSGNLYLALSSVLYAYRATDLEPLWQEETPVHRIVDMVVDLESLFVAVQGEHYDGDTVSFDLRLYLPSGELLFEHVPEFEMDEWRLTWADSGSGLFVFSAREYPPRLPARLHMWQTDLEGYATGEARRYADGIVYGVVGQPWVYVLGRRGHTISRVEGAALDVRQTVSLGIELHDAVFDHDRDRLYVNDTASRLYALSLDALGRGVLDVEKTILAGSGDLTLDSQAGLLLAAHADGDGQRVSVVDLDAFHVTYVITGGDRVALDRRRARAIVGRRPAIVSMAEGGTHVWDLASGEWLAELPETGAPAYGALRDEIYLAEYGCHVYDAETLERIGSLTPDIDAQTCKRCSGETAVLDISTYPDMDLLVLQMTTMSAGHGAGLVPAPRTYSLDSLEPMTHTASFFSGCGPAPIAMAPIGGRVYQNLVYTRYQSRANARALAVGDGAILDWRAGLQLDFVSPDGEIGFVSRNGLWLALDMVDWTPIGYTPRYCVHSMDKRLDVLLAMEGAQLTLLRPRWGRPERPLEPQSAPYDRGLRAVHPSPGYGVDHTMFTVGDAALYRSRDGGETWMRLYGGLPNLERPGAASHLVAAVSPAFGYDHTLYAGGWDGGDCGLGVWRSTDGGETWHPMWYGLEHLAVERIVLSDAFARDNTLLAYCRYDDLAQGSYGVSVYMSDDRGETWRQVALSRKDASADEPLPRPEELIGGVASVGVSGRHAAEAARRSSADSAPNASAPMIPLAEGERVIAVSVSASKEAGQPTRYVLTTRRLYRAVAAGDGWTVTAASDLAAQPGVTYVELAISTGADGADLLFLGEENGAVSVWPATAISWRDE